MMPSKIALSTYRGDSFGVVIRLWADVERTEPADLTGTEIRAQLRTTTDDSQVLGEFDVSTADNVITLTLPIKVSQELDAKQVFDVEVCWDPPERTQVQTVVVGSLAVTPDVTRVG